MVTESNEAVLVANDVPQSAKSPVNIPAGILKRTEADLDAAVARFKEQVDGFREHSRLSHEHASEGVSAYWRMGQIAQHIDEHGLYKLRTVKGDGGKERPKWSGFDAFAHEELGITPGYAKKLLHTAKEYTEAQLRALGITKALRILDAAPEDRAHLVEQGEGGFEAGCFADDRIGCGLGGLVEASEIGAVGDAE